jgi:hypothetical protein
MVEFSDFISEHTLMDLPLGGGVYSWLISHDPHVWSRIDRFCLSGLESYVFGGFPEKATPLVFESLPYSS